MNTKILGLVSESRSGWINGKEILNVCGGRGRSSQFLKYGNVFFCQCKIRPDQIFVKVVWLMFWARLRLGDVGVQLEVEKKQNRF